MSTRKSNSKEEKKEKSTLLLIIGIGMIVLAFVADAIVSRKLAKKDQ